MLTPWIAIRDRLVRYASTLRFPKLLAVTAALFAIDLIFPDMVPYMTNHAEALIKAKKIKKVPDWKTALRPEFMKKAMG